LVFLL